MKLFITLVTSATCLLCTTLFAAPVSITLEDGTIAISQRNDALGELAKENGGAFVVAGNGKEDMSQLAAVIRGKYKNQQQGEVRVKEQVEYFYYPLGLGLLFLLIAFSSTPRRREI